MQALIGHGLVKQLRPAEKPFEVRDTRTSGFLLRVQPSGVMTYYAEYGRGKRIRLGRTNVIAPGPARDAAKEILSSAQSGKDPMEERRLSKAHTLRSFIDEVYEPTVNFRTAAKTVDRLRSSFAEHLDKKLGDLTPWIIEKWRSARIKDGVKPATVNRDLADLKSALTKAVEWDKLDANPIAGVKLSKIDSARDARFLSTEEEARLCAHWTIARSGSGGSVTRRTPGATSDNTSCCRTCGPAPSRITSSRWCLYRCTPACAAASCSR